jgi:hypothetical protein
VYADITWNKENLNERALEPTSRRNSVEKVPSLVHHPRLSFENLVILVRCREPRCKEDEREQLEADEILKEGTINSLLGRKHEE